MTFSPKEQATHEIAPRIAARRAFGGAYDVMSYKLAGTIRAFAWPTSRFAVMGAAGAVDLPLTDEAFGQRHSILADPSGVLVDVVKPIPPSAEFAAQYSPDALERVSK